MSKKVVRLRRIFRADGRAVVVVLDHARFKHEATGLEDIEGIIEKTAGGDRQHVSKFSAV